MDYTKFFITFSIFLLSFGALVTIWRFQGKNKEEQETIVIQSEKQNCKHKQFEIFGKTYQLDFLKECE
jgi:hypothetical protein